MTGRRKHGRIYATYAYTDEAGTLLYEVVRTTPRGFYHRRPDGKGGWIKNLDGTRRVLYRLSEVVAAIQRGDWIYVVEGERDADNLAALGLTATTNSGGPGRWRKEHTTALEDAIVAVLPDHDERGRRHGRKVATALHGVAAAVWLVELPELPAGGDVTDWIVRMERDGADPDTIRAELERFVMETDVWEPGEEAGSDEDGQGAGEAAAEKAMRELWALGKDPEPTAVKNALARVARNLEGADPLTRQTAREVALRSLKGKVSSPAKLVDAALTRSAVSWHTSEAEDEPSGSGSPYLATDDGLIRLKSTQHGTLRLPLTNFTARIVGEVGRDDGVDIRRSFEIEADHLGRVHRFEVGSREFPTMRWVSEALGAQAIVNAGSGTRDHARAAIQYLSDQVKVRTVFTHLGWREIDGEWLYLHGGGAIGTVGTVSELEVDPPEQLRLYTLPDPPAGQGLIRAIRASLRCLGLLADSITLPLYAGTWRAILGPSDFSLHLAGPTGEGKSELAALQAQHFGSGMDARHLPGAWSSTGNSLEVLAFGAKDALLVVDDFAPSGTSHDVQHQHREAARLLRAKGNQAGRGRLRSDGTLQRDKPPRALILSTGEDVPIGHSIRARMLVLEVPAGEMDWDLLTDCQKDARSGLYAQAMAGYLRWLAPRYEEVQLRLGSRTAALRAQASATPGHRRTPATVAQLTIAMEVFLEYACEVGAMEEVEAQALRDRTWAALGEATAAQAGLLEAANPVPRFLELLRSAIVAGRAFVASKNGDEPAAPSRWGWRERTFGAGDNERVEWQPQGDQIGWVVKEDLYLDPDAAYGVAQRMAQQDGLTVTSRTLWKRLKEAGKLVATDEHRQRYTVRVTLQGSRREVLHFRATTLMPAEPSQPSQKGAKAASSGTVSWDGLLTPAKKLSQGTVPAGAPQEAPVVSPRGVGGTVGTVAGTQSARGKKEWEEV